MNTLYILLRTMGTAGTRVATITYKSGRNAVQEALETARNRYGNDIVSYLTRTGKVKDHTSNPVTNKPGGGFIKKDGSFTLRASKNLSTGGTQGTEALVQAAQARLGRQFTAPRAFRLSVILKRIEMGQLKPSAAIGIIGGITGLSAAVIASHLGVTSEQPQRTYIRPFHTGYKPGTPQDMIALQEEGRVPPRQPQPLSRRYIPDVTEVPPRKAQEAEVPTVLNPDVFVRRPKPAAYDASERTVYNRNFREHPLDVRVLANVGSETFGPAELERARNEAILRGYPVDPPRYTRDTQEADKSRIPDIRRGYGPEDYDDFPQRIQSDYTDFSDFDIPKNKGKRELTNSELAEYYYNIATISDPNNTTGIELRDPQDASKTKVYGGATGDSWQDYSKAWEKANKGRKKPEDPVKRLVKKATSKKGGGQVSSRPKSYRTAKVMKKYAKGGSVRKPKRI